jgi:esterase/lipase
MKRKIIMGFAIFFGVLAALILLIALYLWFAPLGYETLVSKPNPARTYDEAMQRIAAVQAQDNNEILDICHTNVLTHGRKTERVIVLLHGFTNCPHQYEVLGQQLFALGYNVYIPRIPYMGYVGRTNAAQERMMAEDVIRLGDEAVDIAQGLGEHVTVFGLSGQGVLTGWLAQHRDDVDYAMVIAASLGYVELPSIYARPVTTLLLTVPNQYIWWDNTVKENIPGNPHAYAWFSTRAVAQYFRLGQLLLQEAGGSTPPNAARILVVVNGNDRAVNYELLNELVARWQTNGENVERYEFATSLNLPHDLIDPKETGAKIDVSYPLLIELIQRADADAGIAPSL